MTVSASLKEGQPSTTVVYPVAGGAEKSQTEGLTFSIATKWEGDALLANIIVGGQSEYSISERWVRARDASLTVTRTVQDRNSTAESVLFYDNGLPVALPNAPPSDFVLQPGTRIPLRLTNAIDSGAGRSYLSPDRRARISERPPHCSARLVRDRNRYRIEPRRTCQRQIQHQLPIRNHDAAERNDPRFPVPRWKRGWPGQPRP